MDMTNEEIVREYMQAANRKALYKPGQELEDGVEYYIRLEEHEAVIDAMKVALYDKDREIENLRTQLDPPNDPLTLEELREMGDEWIWIEILVPGYFFRLTSGYYTKKAWSSTVHKLCCGCLNLIAGDFAYATYGDTWLAYRRRPEEAKT